MLDQVTIVIRSVGERTEKSCRDLLIADGFDESQITTIHEVPFSASLKKSLEIGIEKRRRWTLALDADVLVTPGSIRKLMELGDLESQDMIVIQGLILDKFFALYRPAGNRLYRTSLLPRIIGNIPAEGSSLKPETDMLKKTLQVTDLYYRQVSVVVGLHDYEQSYADVARKCFLHAHKFKGLFMAELTRYWESKARTDFDFQVAIWSSELGGKSTGQVFVSKDHAKEEIQAMFKVNGVKEKETLGTIEQKTVTDIIQLHDKAASSELKRMQDEIFPKDKWEFVHRRPSIAKQNIFKKGIAKVKAAVRRTIN